MNKVSLGQYVLRNHLHSILWLAGVVALLSLVGWLLAGISGMVGSLLVGVSVLISAPRFTPKFILRLLNAKLIRPDDAPRLYRITTILSERAETEKAPMLYHIPGGMINAFTIGLNESAVIVLSDGMLR